LKRPREKKKKRESWIRRGGARHGKACRVRRQKTPASPRPSKHPLNQFVGRGNERKGLEHQKEKTRGQEKPQRTNGLVGAGETSKQKRVSCRGKCRGWGD